MLVKGATGVCKSECVWLKFHLVFNLIYSCITPYWQAFPVKLVSAYFPACYPHIWVQYLALLFFQRGVWLLYSFHFCTFNHVGLWTGRKQKYWQDVDGTINIAVLGVWPDDIFHCIYLNENVKILIKISLKFLPRSPVDKIPALVQMVSGHNGHKPKRPNLNGLKPKRPQTEMAINRNGHRPKRPQTEMAMNWMDTNHLI